MKLTLHHLFGALFAFGASFTLGACESPVTDGHEGDEDSGDAETGEGEEALSYEPGCGGGPRNWCLAKCRRTGDHLHVVGRWDDVGGCPNAGEQFCRSKRLGYRTHTCWGHR